MTGSRNIVDEITGHRRMRRNRKAEWTRRLVQENRLTVDDLIWPVFVVPGTNVTDPVAAMPGVNRMSVDRLVEAAREAARLRFRPIVMTSLAFVLGVMPLVLATGAGAAARRSMGTGVFGGMIVATFVATVFVPLFFVLVARRHKPAHEAVTAQPAPQEGK